MTSSTYYENTAANAHAHDHRANINHLIETAMPFLQRHSPT